MGDDVKQERPLPDTQVPDTQEFFENQSETNALNAKRSFDEYQDIALTSARRSQVNYDNLQNITTRSLSASVDLQIQLNNRMLASIDRTSVEESRILAQRERFADAWNYETAYDLGNPMTTGTADNLRAGGAPANRMTDTIGAVAGGAVDVAAAGVSTANIAVLQQLVATLAAMLPVLVTAAGGASTPSQTQAKPTA